MAVTSDFDLLVVGGGLAGASFATALARDGARVLVVERERLYRDRVRGDEAQLRVSVSHAPVAGGRLRDNSRP